VRTDNSGPKQAGISFLLIDMKQPGVVVRPIVSIAGDHEVNEVFFDNAETSVENIVGEEGQGWAIAKFLLANERRGSCRAPKLLADIARISKLSSSTASGCHGTLGQDAHFTRSLAELELEALALETLELRILAEFSKGEVGGGKISISKLIGSSLRQKVEPI